MSPASPLSAAARGVPGYGGGRDGRGSRLLSRAHPDPGAPIIPSARAPEGPDGPVRLRYQTLEIGPHDVHLRTLRDLQQLGDADGEAAGVGVPEAMWSVFGVVWPSGLALARLMADEDIAGRRIVEVGCGIGLASQVLNARGADITATDRHPEAARFLAFNTDLNAQPAIPFVRAGWTDDEAAEFGTFDLIIGSDLLYERKPAAALAAFVARHARPTCEVLLLDPRRGHAARFAAHMAELGFSAERVTPQSTDDAPAYDGHVYRFRRD